MMTTARRTRRRSAPARLLFVLASACAAPAASGPGSEPDILDPGPDFGYIPNAIGIVQPGRTYVETAAELDHGPASGARSGRVPVLVRSGVAEDWEARVEVWPLQVEEDALDRTTGAGPLQVGFKHRVSRGEGHALAPAWGFEVELILPLASADFDDGKVEPGAWFNADHTLSEDGTLTWNAGFLTPVDDAGSQYVQTYLAGAYSYFMTPEVQLYATGSWNASTSSRGDSLAFVGAGLYWYFCTRTVLVAGYNAGLTSESVDGLGTLGLSFAF